MPLADASVSTMNGWENFGKASTRAEINAFLKAWKVASVSDVQMNNVPFLSKLVRGLEIKPNWETNLL
jgi:hypothetical protein